MIETPGHAPSHVCLHQPEQRLLITGDHLLGRVSQYFDVGYTPDPVGEFLRSLDVVDALDARLALAGHARPFTDIRGHIEANRELVARNLAAVARRAARTASGPPTRSRATVFGEQLHRGDGELADDDDDAPGWRTRGAAARSARPRRRRGSGRALGNLDIVVSGLR